MRVSIGADVTTALSIEQSAMASGRGRGHCHDRERDYIRGRGLFGGGCGFSGARLTVSDKGPGYVSIAKN